MSLPVVLTVFQGRAGDHNARAIPGAAALGKRLSDMLGLTPIVIGTPEPPLNLGWQRELEMAMPSLRAMAEHYDAVLGSGSVPLTASSRCAVSLATLPPLAKHCPDACVVWFDAHPDLNTPDTTATGYLGGLSLSGPAGLWESGLGAGLRLSNVVLVGARDIDSAEQAVIDAGAVRLVAPGKDFGRRLREAVGGRPVYVHLDCDVLNPGIVPTDYRHEGGLSLADLREACGILAQNEVVGLEIAEFENAWEVGGAPVSPDPILDAVMPLIRKLIH
jgi:arginase